MRLTARLALIACFAALLAGCASLPRGAALQKDVLASARAETPDIAIYPVTHAFLPVVATWPRNTAPRHNWISTSTGSAAQIIRPGDTLAAQIWDTGENALLSTPDQRTTHLPALRVSEAGMIFVPYVGRVKVSGRTPEAARSLIERKLEEVVPSVQVQLTMAEGRQNSVDLVTGVRNPGNVILPDQNFTVLSAITAGGGVDPALTNPQIKLLRAHKTYVASLQNLFDNPRLDTRLHGGDKLLIEPDARLFLALGAAGKEAQIPFNNDTVSALDALALMGGLLDNRADPQGVLILRQYPAQAVASDASGPDNIRVVFTLDLTTSDGLFSARKFLIEPRDVILATESPVSDTRTILGLAGSAIGIATAANFASN